MPSKNQKLNAKKNRRMEEERLARSAKPMKKHTVIANPEDFPARAISAELRNTDNGAMVGFVSCSPKHFKTGSDGYYANGKVEIGGKRYQMQIQLVEVGSKDRNSKPTRHVEEEDEEEDEE